MAAAFAPADALPEIQVPTSAGGALRGLGRMTARVPGRTEVVGGVTLARHEVRVDVRQGIATTTVEEVFLNETDRVLEGRYVFPVPASASVSRLALWVGDELVEGEMVERDRAARIFRGIVDDTVRPRDPALLEWAQGSELSLKIFPIPARGDRRVLLSYEEPLSELAGAGRYVYPLSAGEDRGTKVGHLSVVVRIEGDDVIDIATPSHAAAITNERGATTVSFTADDVAPDRDFVLTWKKPKREAAVAALDASTRSFLLRAPVDLPASADVPPARGSSRVVVLDASRSQSAGTLAAQASLATAAVAAMEEGDRFAVLACDSACTSYPEDGLATASPEMGEALRAWLARLTPKGSSDLGGAITAGAQRLPPTDGAQLILLSDGSPSSGELTVGAIVARARAALAGEADVRVVGIGRSVDELVLRAVADGVEATYERLDPGASPARRIDEVVLGLAQPVVRGVEVELPSGATLAAAAPRALRLGDELQLAGAGGMGSGETLRLRGRLGQSPYERAFGVTVSDGPAGLAGRAFARARIDALMREGGAAHDAEIVDLSRRFFVLSRKTSLLVLENDAMFRAFGIERTRSKDPTSNERKIPKVRMGGELPEPSGIGPAGGPPVANWGSLLRDGDLGAKGNMWGDEIGSSFGSGGLGLSGIGEGGGGKGEGKIGLGNIGTIGRGADTGTGQGFGSGHGRLGGSHRSKPPQVRLGATSVSGRLPPEVIQRIVRQNFGRFRLCYERGLRNDPNLSGTVVVSFVIGESGAVSSTTAGGSLADKEVSSCVASSFARLSFPQPEGGQVRVRYPLSFSPGDDAPASSSTWRPSTAPSWTERPTPTHVETDGAWTTLGEPDLERLRATLASDDTKRSAHVALVRGLVLRGRFAEAQQRAAHLAELDPDSADAVDLLAQASLASGDRVAALSALDGLAELSPGSARVHRRIARGMEAAGDERRACAHWRSLVSLEPSDKEAKVESSRCRARVMGERTHVLDELSTGRDDVHPNLAALLTAVRVGSVPAYTAPAPSGVVSAKASCDGGLPCPEPVSIDAAGRVISPFLPSERGEAWARLDGWQVRTVLVGGGDGVRVKLTVTAGGASRTVTFDHAATLDHAAKLAAHGARDRRSVLTQSSF
jgi:Ca-activated chloride channel family protein